MEYPLRRLVRESKDVFGKKQEYVPSRRTLTPATLISRGRLAILGPITAWKVWQGDPSALKWLAATGASDAADGFVARLFSKYLPDSGLGVSEGGIREDVIADSAAIGEIGGVIMVGDTASRLGKIAAAIIIGQEIKKALWARSADNEYKAATATKENPDGTKLVIPSVEDGRLAMVEKFIAGTAIVATSSTKNPVLRTAEGVAGIGFAVASVYHAERAQPEYRETFAAMLAEARAANPIPYAA